MRSTGFTSAETQAAARDELAGVRRCELCHGVGFAGESVPGRVPGDVIVWADSTGFFAMEDDQGGRWRIEQDKLPADLAAFFDCERQQAHADVDARFDSIRAVLVRRAMLPDQLFVPIKPHRLLDVEEEEAKNEKALTKLQAAEAQKERETRRDKAVQLLRAMFAKGPEVSAKEATAQAEAAGITRDAIFRARRVLRVEVRKNGRAGWFWRLPSTVQNTRSSDSRPHPDAADHGCQAPAKEAVASLGADAVIPAPQHRPMERAVIAPRPAPTCR